MNKNTANNKTERTQVAVKNVAFCSVVLLVFSIGLSSLALAANNPPVAYKADAGRITIEVEDSRAIIDCRCKVHHKTGVEMEALTGASVAALTVYDMCKAMSHDIVIGETRLMSKTGGKEDFHRGD